MNDHHRLVGGAAESFLRAGNALFTVENTRTGNHFTFRVLMAEASQAPAESAEEFLDQSFKDRILNILAS